MPSLEGLARVAPGDVLVLVREQLVQIALGPPRGLLALSLLGALWSSSSAMTAIIETLNQAYHVREGRSWWRVRLLAVVLTVVLTAFTLAAVGLMMAGPTLAHQLENSLGVPRRFAWLWAIAEWPVVFGLMVTALGWVYQLRARRAAATDVGHAGVGRGDARCGCSRRSGWVGTRTMSGTTRRRTEPSAASSWCCSGCTRRASRFSSARN